MRSQYPQQGQGQGDWERSEDERMRGQQGGDFNRQRAFGDYPQQQYQQSQRGIEHPGMEYYGSGGAYSGGQGGDYYQPAGHGTREGYRQHEAMHPGGQPQYGGQGSSFGQGGYGQGQERFGGQGGMEGYGRGFEGGRGQHQQGHGWGGEERQPGFGQESYGQHQQFGQPGYGQHQQHQQFTPQGYGGQQGNYGQQGGWQPSGSFGQHGGWQQSFGQPGMQPGRSGARRGPKDYTRSDERIREALCERLAEEHAVDVSDVSVQVDNGKVILEGSVPDRRMRHRIEDIADECWGVKDVENRVRVQSGQYGMSSSELSLSSGTATSNASDASGKEKQGVTGLGGGEAEGRNK